MSDIGPDEAHVIHKGLMALLPAVWYCIKACTRRRERTRKWIGRKSEHCLYGTLLEELKAEDPKSFIAFLRVPPELFEELLARVGPLI